MIKKIIILLIILSLGLIPSSALNCSDTNAIQEELNSYNASVYAREEIHAYNMTVSHAQQIAQKCEGWDEWLTENKARKEKEDASLLQEKVEQESVETNIKQRLENIEEDITYIESDISWLTLQVNKILDYLWETFGIDLR